MCVPVRKMPCMKSDSYGKDQYEKLRERCKHFHSKQLVTQLVTHLQKSAAVLEKNLGYDELRLRNSFFMGLLCVLLRRPPSPFPCGQRSPTIPSCPS